MKLNLTNSEEDQKIVEILKSNDVKLYPQLKQVFLHGKPIIAADMSVFYTSKEEANNNIIER